jgi:hypothetical protein
MSKTTFSDRTRGSDDDIGSEEARQFAAQHPGLVKFARIGWVAKGVVYSLIGVLSMLIGLEAARNDGATGGESGSGAGEASQSGAITAIAQNTGGAILLWVMAAGLVLYAMWRFVTVALPADNSAKAWATRIGYLVSGIVYVTLAFTAVTIARSPGGGSDGDTSGSGGEDGRVERFTTDLMESTGGRWLVGALGVGLFILAGVFVYKAVSASFERELIHRGVGPLSFDRLILLGRIGWIGRAAMMALIGFFLTRAAVQFDAEDANGLDDSLREAAGSTPGTVLVFVVAIGLLVYGAFCILSAPRQRLVGAES